MDYIPLIIGIIIAIAVSASKNKKAKQASSDGTPPEGHGENFPFPKELRELFGLDEEVVNEKPAGRYQSIEDQELGVENFEPYEEGVATTQMPVQKISEAHHQMNIPISQRSMTIVADAPMEVERSIEAQRATTDFDLQRAVIYSEILKPKYL